MAKIGADGWASLDSSALAAMSWTPTSGLLIQFNDGAVYNYPGVSLEMALELMEDPSPGTFFNMYIRPRFPFGGVTKRAPVKATVKKKGTRRK